MKKVICQSLFSLICLFTFTQSVWADNIDKLVIFGDSLSDNGNMFHYSKALHDVEDFFPIIPDTPYVTGHFSNGKTWTEYLFDKLAKKHWGKNFKLQNYAVGGAVTSDASFREMELNLSAWPIHFLPQEVTHYLDDQSSVVPDKTRSQHLFLMWIGANDYLNPILQDETSIDVEALTTNVINAIHLQLCEIIMKSGAKHIVIVNLPDLGQTPFGLVSGDKLSSVMTQLTLVHNQKLAALISELQALHPNVDFISIDANEIFNTILTTHHWRGVEIPETSFPCYIGSMSKDLNKTRVLMVPPQRSVSRFMGQKQYAARLDRVCDAPDTYLFWDFIHPTTMMHQLIADEVYDRLAEHQLQ